MQISNITLCNFRCFGPEPTTIILDNVTALIGENGSGKSAAMLGLARLFGLTKSERTVRADDFFLPVGKSRNDAGLGSLELWIDVRLDFPEMADPNGAKIVSQHFKQMLVDAPGEAPYCRIRLSAKWTRGNLPEGEIEQSLSWIRQAGNLTDPIDQRQCKRVDSYERQRIHVHYVPGARDPAKHVAVSSGSLLKRLLDAAKWNEGLEQAVEQSTASLTQAFADEPAIAELRNQLNASWQSLCNRSRFTQLALELEGRSLQDLVSSFSAQMQTDNKGESVLVDRLSDGLRSLLYFAIVETAFKIEQDVIDNAESSVFDADSLAPPNLTIFAIEEPETHLAPHLLGRVLKTFREISRSPRAQAVFSSHSASVLSRIAPQEVRHLRLRPEDARTQVSMIAMPEDGTEADKYVREAVRAFPELYFARLVVLGEGDSEQVVLARLLQANGLESDPNVISVVPLGGRHVNHLWRLLSSLSIPYLTLLDLDREREGGGWGRIHYVCSQLLLLGHGDEVRGGVSPEQFGEMPKWDVADINLETWITHLENYRVYFSNPLDLDLSMLRSFSTWYSDIASGKPREFSVNDEPTKTKQVRRLLYSVLGVKTGISKVYSEVDIELFRWYRFFFLNGSKPATHMAALSQIDDGTLIQNCPPELSRFIAAIKHVVGNE